MNISNHADRPSSHTEHTTSADDELLRHIQDHGIRYFTSREEHSYLTYLTVQIIHSFMANAHLLQAASDYRQISYGLSIRRLLSQLDYYHHNLSFELLTYHSHK